MSDKPGSLIPTRYSLLSRLQDWDDQESWKDFFDTYWRLIYGVARNSGLSEAEAQDVVQETVICVASKIQKFKRDRALGSFKGWLRNITRWRIADQLRKRLPGRTPIHDLAEDEPGGVDLEQIADTSLPALDDLWEQQWRENLLEAATARIKRRVKEEQFQMFDLHVMKKWPVARVAKALGVSAGRVYLAKHRIAGQIKKEIQRLEKEFF